MLKASFSHFSEFRFILDSVLRIINDINDMNYINDSNSSAEGLQFKTLQIFIAMGDEGRRESYIQFY